jgi:hypothetical protein
MSPSALVPYVLRVTETSCFGYTWDSVAQDHYQNLGSQSFLIDSELPKIQANGIG